MQKFTVKTIVAIGIGAALFFLLARFASIPVFANTYISFQYALLAFFAVLFGPIAGLLIGLIGHVLTDLSFGFGLWWSWIFVSAIVGFGFGFVMKGVNVELGEFNNAKAVLRFVIGAVIIHLVCWGLIAPVLDILIYAEPANKVFVQGLIAGVANAVTAAVIGSILLFIYSKTRPKTGSLKKD
jgi:energy-coupling factor transport system substrate-specific component